MKAWKVCPVCKGSGEVGTGEREPDTGAWVTRECTECSGTGYVDAEE